MIMTFLPSEQEFNNIPTLELVADADNADALRRQLILPPALPIAPFVSSIVTACFFTVSHSDPLSYFSIV